MSKTCSSFVAFAVTYLVLHLAVWASKGFEVVR